MRKLKRLVAVALAGTMVFSVVGCKKSSKDEVVELTVFSQLANYNGYQTGWFADILEEKFGVKLNIIPENTGEVYETRMQSKDLGDIVVWGTNGEKYLSAVKEGMLYDWNEDNLVEEYGDYIYANMQDALKQNANISSDAGVTYGVGMSIATSTEDHQSFIYSWDVRWDLYKELGYPTVNNLDDFYDMLVDMKEICPTDDNGNEMYAVSLWPDWDDNMVMYVKATATAYYGYDELGMGLYNCETGEFYDCLDPDGPYIEMLKFYNKLYRAGLLDPDSMNNTYDKAAEKVQKGGTLFSIFNYSGSLAFNTDAHIKENKMMCALAPAESRPLVYGMSTLGSNYIVSIGANTKYPEKCMEVINYLATPEGFMTSNYGPEGLCWYYGDDGLTYFTEVGKKAHFDVHQKLTSDDEEFAEYADQEIGDGNNETGIQLWALDAVNPVSGERYNDEFWASQATEAGSDIEKDWREKTGTNSYQSYMETTNYMVSKMSTYAESPKSDDLKVTWAQVKKDVVDGTWKAMYATSDEEFDNYVQTMIDDAKGHGYADCVEWSENEAALRFSCEQLLGQSN